MQIVPVDPRGSGNTKPTPKQIAPAKRWSITLNNYKEEQIDPLLKKLDKLCKVVIVAKEVGDVKGTPHLQAYAEFHCKLRPKNLFTKEIHWEKCKGSRCQNVAYCSKEGDIIFEKGLKAQVDILQESQLRDWQKGILEMLKDKPNDRTIHWYWSDEGGVGKTTFSKYLSVTQGAIPIGGKSGDQKNAILSYYDKFGDYPRVIIYPIPRSGKINYIALEQLKDMYFYSPKYEGGVVCGNPPHLLVFANAEPDYECLSKDRWRVHKI